MPLVVLLGETEKAGIGAAELAFGAGTGAGAGAGSFWRMANCDSRFMRSSCCRSRPVKRAMGCESSAPPDAAPMIISPFSTLSRSVLRGAAAGGLCASSCSCRISDAKSTGSVATVCACCDLPGPGRITAVAAFFLRFLRTFLELEASSPVAIEVLSSSSESSRSSIGYECSERERERERERESERRARRTWEEQSQPSCRRT